MDCFRSTRAVRVPEGIAATGGSACDCPSAEIAAAVIPAGGSPLAVIRGASAQTLAEEKRTALQAAAVLQKEKDQAWVAFYSAPTSCERPLDWNAQVECGNQYLRAQKRFEAQWVAEHASDQTTGKAVVLVGLFNVGEREMKISIKATAVGLSENKSG